MVKKLDYYVVLGLTKDAQQAKIKSAYRKLVKKYHPDANPDDPNAEDKIKEINEAFEVLSDPQKRADYDNKGHMASGQGKARNDSGPFSGPFSDPFSGGFNTNADINFDNLFGKSFRDVFKEGREKSEPNRGRDVSINIQIAYEEAMKGAKREVSFSFSEACTSCNGSGSMTGTMAGVCKHCNGSGQERVITQSAFGKMTKTQLCPVCQGTGKDMAEACPQCAGSGFIRINKKIMVKIPQGVTNGQTISVRGMGEPGEQGGPRGNLRINVSVRPKYSF
jgi:molecular chaperone DnaJ